ncbi:G-box-binding factor 1-like [Gigantopelta aegis]|uniref:G-box-binding factor 1-like n=1 Tax=Gigantopelta aegis TaxID=1735272 RepID=UPI001B88DCB7|nr:G-box-binding factor 1-like [Gigantopelta aegis]XP_041353093.1 G-box-binding factor 1-like [Gigantopelta aegis]XP_041353094.1 G-box-binding factor 1-like [Gigantopelta aegis]
MKDSLAFEILTNIMSSADEWREDNPGPSTSQDSVDPTIRFNMNDDVFDSFYSDDGGSNPMWTESIVEIGDNSNSNSNSTDFEDVSQSGSYSGTLLGDSMLDVVKVELKSRIQKKRLDSGQHELEVSFDQPSHSKLSKEDRKLRESRKEKNRLAAQKCREKKQKRIDYLETNIDRLENRRTSLKDEVQRLQDEREHLEEVIKVHHIVCPKIRKLGDS